MCVFSFQQNDLGHMLTCNIITRFKCVSEMSDICDSPLTG